MKKFEYCEIPMKLDKPFIEQLNQGGQTGWRFITQAQRLTPSIDFKTGKPKVEIMMIFEREIISGDEMPES